MDREDQWASGGDTGDDPGDDADRDRMLGWISPDDRLWRHPSESAAPATEPSAVLLGRGRSSSRARSGPWIVGGTTACIVLALVAAGAVMVTTGTADQDDPGSAPGAVSLTAAPTTEPGAGHPIGTASVAAMVSSVRPSTVVMTIERTSGTSVTTGLVAESGGIIVTTSGALTGAKAITVVEPGGSRQVAELVGIDEPSGLAVVRIGDDLPAATFDNGDPIVGAGAIALALEPGHQAEGPTPVVYAGTVVSAGRAAAADPITTTFAATAIRAPLSHEDLGCPLLDAAGHVSGLLEKTVQDGGSTISVFLPADLVLGVARQLVSSGAVVHGSLGIHTSDADSTTSTPVGTAAAPTTGARLDTIEAGSPAAINAMAPGDIITRIDGYPVQSSAELMTRLYPERPGTPVLVTFIRGGTPTTMTVTLATADPDAQGGYASP